MVTLTGAEGTERTCHVRADRELPTGLSVRTPAGLAATWFGVGFLPKAPGTWGSLAALPFAWAIHQTLGRPGLAAAIVIVFVVGVWSSTVIVGRGGSGDPSAIVVDEVVGQWLVLVVVHPDVFLYAAGFVLFRAADIVKPWPVSWVDRRVKGGLGVMLDDVAAAAYAAAVLYGLARWLEP
jgi:phosphatidylglycerophosphatase A